MTVTTPARPTGNLPADVTSMIGRQREVAESLLVREEDTGRVYYRMLDTIRDFCRGEHADRALARRHRDQCRARLGHDGFDRSYRRGTRLTMDEAISGYLVPLTAEAAPPQTPPEETPIDRTPSALTRRENQIAELVTKGLSNQQIATAQRTVEGHVEHILTKLCFASRSQIAAWVARGSLDP